MLGSVRTEALFVFLVLNNAKSFIIRKRSRNESSNSSVTRTKNFIIENSSLRSFVIENVTEKCI